LLERKWDFFRTLEHELTHILVALLFFQPPHSLRVNASGSGEAAYRGKGNFLISLAPYYFSPAAIVTALLIFIAAHSVKPILVGLVVTFLCRHLVNAIGEIISGQYDLAEHGYAFSLSAIAALLVLFDGTIASFALQGESGVGEFYAKSWELAYQSGGALIRLLGDYGHEALAQLSRNG
jgi:hypothetical protein